MTPPKTPAYPLWGLLAALAGFAALQLAAFLIAGVFEYALDDVYIHLAMASNIAHGAYGVNAGEAASAASSIVYPLLLLPFPDTEFQRFLPLFWNILAVGAAGWVWGRIVLEAGLAGVTGAFLALAGPILLNIPGTGYTGMEAAPHVLASLMIVLGLWRALNGADVAPWFIAAAILAPLLRYEGLALALGAAGVLMVTGKARAGLVIALGAVGGVVGFGLFLMSLGLPPLPGSVLAKSASAGAMDGVVLRQFILFLINATKPAGAIIAALVLVTLLAMLALPALRRGPAAWLLAVVAAAALGHLAFGQIGWMHRYEPYILASLVAATLLASGRLDGGAAATLRGASVVAVLAAGAAYMPALWGKYIWNPSAIHLQQAQMARFAQGYLNAPVAVNDLGRVAWRNPNYVLDIWGLGSDEARRILYAKTPPADGWAGPLAARHGVRAAMIYDAWFAKAVGPDWVRVALLTMDFERGRLGGWTVSFYATDPGFAPRMREELERFAPTLPEGAFLTILPQEGA